LESSSLFKTVIKKAVVKVGGGTKEEKVPLILVNEFFGKLKEIGLLKKEKEH
jgi:predicted transcriptional regulator